MGTLFNQIPRDWRKVEIDTLLGMYDMIKKVKSQTDLNTEQIIELLKIAEMSRKNVLYVNNGDAFDEQIAGIGGLLNELNSQISIIADSFLEQNNNN